MFVLGHAGIAIGVAALLDKAVGKLHPAFQSDSIQVSFLSRVDLRVLAVDSVLPDILDKPIGLMIFRDERGTGRIFCHTLLFLGLLSIAGFGCSGGAGAPGSRCLRQESWPISFWMGRGRAIGRCSGQLSASVSLALLNPAASASTGTT